MAVKQISVFLENRPGTLVELTKVLAEHDLDMRAFSLAESSDFGIARIIVDDVYAATTVLKDAGFIHSVTPVAAVAIPDVPGGLSEVLAALSESGINVEYMYAFLGGKTANSAYMIFRTADVNKTCAVLQVKGFRLAEQDELSEL